MKLIYLLENRQIVLLFWKTILLLFGDIKDVDDSKVALRQEMDIGEHEHDPSFITTSPLDYHLFRQEITSKYPAYCPPLPLVPIEEENNSILPPLPNHPSQQASQENLRTSAGTNAGGAGRSIFNQPVHIATPAPSPPPSPAGPGGKAGKKQNYQTNQNFPFLYPPLDGTSNTVGGKGNADLQDQLVGKRWEGSDVPASILEAGQLFASRMRMSRSIRQLWDVREKFIKYERGWNRSRDDHDSLHEFSKFDSDENEEEGEAEQSSTFSRDEERKLEKETDNEDLQRRLDSINSYYVRKFGCRGMFVVNSCYSTTIYHIYNLLWLSFGNSSLVMYQIWLLKILGTHRTGLLARTTAQTRPKARGEQTLVPQLTLMVWQTASLRRMRMAQTLLSKS